MKQLFPLSKILIYGLILLFANCNSEDIIPNSEFLIGKWLEIESPDIIQFAGTNHCIEFTSDNFQLKQIYWTDALDPDNDCNNGYTIFYKGSVELTETQLTLTGKYANENFELTPPDCGRAENFEQSFEYKKEGEDVIILNPNEEIYNQIRLERQ